ncbi:MAG: aldose 1-epimerase [Acidobacteriota bacterium]|nr:aldose 1-epimerase [Acidobacteriota bacterium]
MNVAEDPPPVFLRRKATADGKGPEFLEATLLPGRGMNFFQARAAFPGLGNIDLLASPSLEHARRQFGGPDDYMGVHSFKFGGALLLPFANRIRGKLLPDGSEIETKVLGRDIRLPADWHGKEPGAEKCAMHGLILASKMDVIDVTDDRVTATLQAGDFGGFWLSKAEIKVEAALHPEAITFRATTRNVGDEPLPVGIGWHPYFALPSKRREQARLHLPARRRALVNNYDDVFPTGQIESVSGTPYDFTPAEGAPLGSRYFDDSFLDLEKSADGHTVVEILDPSVHYGIRITALSPEVTALQVYSPPDKSFVVVEPVFNLADPFSPVWPPGTDTGMVVLAPGQQATWAVRWELFVV